MNDPNSRYSNSLRRKLKRRSCKHLDCFNQSIIVVHRLPHSHENNISNLRVTGCMDQLLHNFSRRKIAFESHCSSSTESAAHLAPNL
uniref:Uncharacterized protein n=1 Tax=Arundo donax TaxID=35708 RepID=A0A0A9E0M6_ARUDO